MFSIFHKLTEADAQRAAVGRHAAGRGLSLCRDESGAAEWTLDFEMNGERRELRLGAYPEMSVKVARAEAAKWRRLVRSGFDPTIQQEKIRADAARNLHQFYC
ncbi:hypothetical protein C1J03_20820 [Sulfitobacter sp. SK012]|uniref:Arm DNA-binding domain-containing protein n=1 Tax=Sulfitobacter sp. SK012 TaxID=1389005 RepID=UPI000E0C28FF|nr:Arm DNA-binding domain-containing protein [Sulfitobacter sp. SK012]AXI48219.1 hypothetical protein C1J03_20820 [Sulfitobacter sp. SK012]